VNAVGWLCQDEFSPGTIFDLSEALQLEASLGLLKRLCFRSRRKPLSRGFVGGL
jgi:hypothetical protein